MREEQQVMPALYLHCETVYRAMQNLAKVERADGDSAISMMVYTGFTTHLFEQLSLSVPYFTSVMSALKRMGCVRQLRRGGGNSPSQWELIREPSREAFLDYMPRRQRRTRTDILEQQVQELQAKLSQLTPEQESA